MRLLGIVAQLHLGEFKIPGENQSINAYGIPSDSENNLYLLEFGVNNIGRIDAKSKELNVYSTSAQPLDWSGFIERECKARLSKSRALLFVDRTTSLRGGWN